MSDLGTPNQYISTRYQLLMKEIDKTYSQLAAVTEQLSKMAAEEDAAAALAELRTQELEQGTILSVGLG